MPLLIKINKACLNCLGSETNETAPEKIVKYYLLSMIGDDPCIAFVRYGGGSRNKQDYKPDIKLEYFDDNGRPLSRKEVLTVCRKN